MPASSDRTDRERSRHDDGGRGPETGSTPVERLARRERAVVVVALAAIVVLAWAYLVTGAGMDAHPMGAAGHEGMAGGTFLVLFGMWAVMMVAMMLPGAAPMILLYEAVSRETSSSGGVSRTGVFATGYLIVWTAFALAAAAVQLVLHRAVLLTPALHTASAILGGVILVAAGLYQLTPFKHACLRRCRSPVRRGTGWLWSPASVSSFGGQRWSVAR